MDVMDNLIFLGLDKVVLAQFLEVAILLPVVFAGIVALEPSALVQNRHVS